MIKSWSNELDLLNTKMKWQTSSRNTQMLCVFKWHLQSLGHGHLLANSNWIQLVAHFALIIFNKTYRHCLAHSCPMCPGRIKLWIRTVSFSKRIRNSNVKLLRISIADQNCKPCLCSVKSTACQEWTVVYSLALVTFKSKAQEHVRTPERTHSCALCIQRNGSLCAAKRTAEQQWWSDFGLRCEAGLKCKILQAIRPIRCHSLRDLLKRCLTRCLISRFNLRAENKRWQEMPKHW